MLSRSLGVSDADTMCICPGISFRVKILCSLWYTETFALCIELGSGSDVTGNKDGGSGLRCGMVDVNGHVELSGP